MKIRDLFQNRSENISLKSSRVEEGQQSKAGPEAVAGEDVVSISPLARRISEMIALDEKDQTERVAELKRQVEAGTYSISNEKLAESIAAYLRDSNQDI